MNIYKTRREILGFLAPKRRDFDSGKLKGDLGLSYDFFRSKFKCSDEEFQDVLSELYFEKEILYTDVLKETKNNKGILSTQKGLTSYANKKYLNRVKIQKRENIRFYIQILIPIISLVIAVLSLFLKFDIIKQELETSLESKFGDKIQNLEDNLKEVKK